MLDSDGQLACADCTQHIDSNVNDPAWIATAALMAAHWRIDILDAMARYLVAFHHAGHPSDNTITEWVREAKQRRNARAAAPMN